jgi:hypothetical protein
MRLQAQQERPATLDHAEVEGPRDRASSRREWMRALAVPVGIFLMSRVVVYAAAAMATWLARPLHFTQVLSGWDGGWYVDIAQNGYPNTVAAEGPGNRWAFFPGLPMVIRGVARATGLSYRHAGILVAFVFALAAAVAVWLAVRRVFGNRVADRTVAVLCFFPTAYTLSMVYTEGLFITTAALCLWLLHEERWALAGLAATASGLTRSVGAVLVLACVVVGLRAVWQRRSVRPLAAVVLAPLGLLAWMLYQWHRVGTPFAFVKAEAAWSHHFVWFSAPFQALWRLLTDRSDWRYAGDVLGAAAVLIVLVTGGLLLWHHLRRSPIPLSWWIYTVGGVLAAFSPFWPTSVPRYVMAVFPLLVMVALYVPRRLEGSLLGSMALLQGVLATIAFVAISTYQTAPFAP